MSAEIHLEINETEEGSQSIHIQKIDSEDFSSLNEAEQVYLQRYIHLGRGRDRVIGSGINMEIIGSALILYGLVKRNSGMVAVGGVINTVGMSLITYGLTEIQKRYKDASNALDQIRKTLASNKD